MHGGMGHGWVDGRKEVRVGREGNTRLKEREFRRPTNTDMERCTRSSMSEKTMHQGVDFFLSFLKKKIVQ